MQHVGEPALRRAHHSQTELSQAFCVSGSRREVAIFLVELRSDVVRMPIELMTANCRLRTEFRFDEGRHVEQHRGAYRSYT